MKIGVVGCGGRMGRQVMHQVMTAAGCELAAVCDRPGAPVLGQDAGVLAGLAPLGISVGDDARVVFEASRVVIDFTTPEATLRHADLAIRHGTALVVGTTGLTAETEAALNAAARHVGVVVAPNMSLGVNLLVDLVKRVARALDDSFDVEIVEMHHRNKVDAPSGTALALGRAAAAGRDAVHDEVAVWQRKGVTGARRAGDIGYAVLRGGDVIGDHTVMFAGNDERIELTHKAGSRAVFARGAVTAARWLGDRPPGRYGMADVLGL